MLFLSAVSCFCFLFHLGVVIHDSCSMKTSLRRVLFLFCWQVLLRDANVRREREKKEGCWFLQTLFPINAVLCFAFHMWLLFSIANTRRRLLLLLLLYHYYYYCYYCYYYQQEKWLSALNFSFVLHFLGKSPLRNQNGKKREILVPSHFLQYDIMPSSFSLL